MARGLLLLLFWMAPGWGCLPDGSTADPQLLSELWTGLRLQGGTAGPPPSRGSWQAALTTLQACVALLILVGALWFFRQSPHAVRHFAVQHEGPGAPPL